MMDIRKHLFLILLCYNEYYVMTNFWKQPKILPAKLTCGHSFVGEGTHCANLYLPVLWNCTCMPKRGGVGSVFSVPLQQRSEWSNCWKELWCRLPQKSLSLEYRCVPRRNTLLKECGLTFMNYILSLLWIKLLLAHC